MSRPRARSFSRIAALLLLAGAGRAEAQAPSPGAGDTLRIAVYGLPASLNPHLSSDARDGWIFHHVFEGLVDLDAEDRYVGRLAESWKASPDATEIVFELRKGAAWHDGKPVTSADVLFTYDSLTKHADASYRSLMSEVAQIDAPSPSQVRVRYKAPFAPALATWTVPVLPAHLFPAAKPYAEASRAFKGVGTGPYRIAAVVADDSILLERNAAFDRPAPPFAKLVFKLMRDATTSVKAIAEENLDVARMRPADWVFNTPDEVFAPAMKKLRCPSRGFTFVSWNCNRRTFQDRRVRRAIAMAIDLEEPNALYLSNLGERAFGPFPASSRYANALVEPIRFDAKEAERQLEAAGFTDHDGDGVRDRDGVMLKWKLLVQDGLSFPNEVSHFMMTALEKVGVRMEYVRLSTPELMRRLQAGDFDAYMLEWSGDVDPDFLYALFHSSQSSEGLNYGRYVNLDVDRLLEEGRRTMDVEARTKVYQQVAAMVYADQAYLFLYFTPTLWGVSTRLEGVDVLPGGPLTGHPGILDWKATRPAQPGRTIRDPRLDAAPDRPTKKSR